MKLREHDYCKLRPQLLEKRLNGCTPQLDAFLGVPCQGDKRVMVQWALRIRRDRSVWVGLEARQDCACFPRRDVHLSRQHVVRAPFVYLESIIEAEEWGEGNIEDADTDSALKEE